MSHEKMNQQGFSLVELMIVVAVGSIVGFGMSKLVTQIYYNISRIEAKMQSLDLKNILETDLSDSNICTANMADQRIQRPFSLPQIIGQDGRALVTAGERQGKVFIDSIRVENVNIPLAANATGRMKLSVYVRRENHQSPMSPIEIPLHVRLNPLSRIQSCHSLRANAATQDCPPMMSPYPGSQARCGPGYIALCDASQPQPHGQNMRFGDFSNCHGWTDYLCVSGTWAVIGYSPPSCGP